MSEYKRCLIELVGCFPPALAFNKKHMLSRNRLDILKDYEPCEYLVGLVHYILYIVDARQFARADTVDYDCAKPGLIPHTRYY